MTQNIIHVPLKLSVISIPAHSDYSNMIDAQFPKTDQGRIMIPRRYFLTQTIGLSVGFLTIQAGLVNISGCDGSFDFSKFAVALVDTLKSIFKISESIKGNVTVVNDNMMTGAKLQVITDLVNEASNSIKRGTGIVDIPPGKSKINYDNLFADKDGQHHITGTLLNSSKESPSFSVTPV